MNRPWGIHAIHDIWHRNVGAEMPDGRYVQAVSVPDYGHRLRAAWWIQTGRAVAMLWPEAGDLEAIFRGEPRNLRKGAGPFKQASTVEQSGDKL